MLTQQVFLIKRDMRLLENFTGFLLDVQEPLQTIHPQRGDMLDLNVHELTIGARGSARWHAPWLGQRQELELGYYARGDSAAGTQQRLEAATGVPYLTDTDLDSQIGDIGLYGDVNLRPVSWLSLRGGARADVLTYQVLDNCAAQTVSHPSPTNLPIDQSCLTPAGLRPPARAGSGHQHVRDWRSCREPRCWSGRSARSRCRPAMARASAPSTRRTSPRTSPRRSRT